MRWSILLQVREKWYIRSEGYRQRQRQQQQNESAKYTLWMKTEKFQQNHATSTDEMKRENPKKEHIIFGV